jgi:RNA polymerase-binding protein DksA
MDAGPAAATTCMAPWRGYHLSMDESTGVDARAALEAERARLREELAATIEAPGQMTYGSQAAAATHVFEQQRDLALRDRATQQLALVEAALARLGAGTFGRCTRCGKPIAPERLEALPWAEHCIECARLIAQGKG